MAEEPEDHLGMTDAQWEAFQKHTQGFGEQDENGVDISLLRRNRRLPPAQRMERLMQALELDREMRRARTAAGLPDSARRP